MSEAHAGSSELRNRSKKQPDGAEKDLKLEEKLREEKRVEKRNYKIFFLLKVFTFLLCFGTFSWYFWPFGDTHPVEFQHIHIRNLNSTDFEPYVLREDGMFRIIKFYANWCDHCKTMAPVWSEAAYQHATDPSLEFLQVECSNNKKLCRKAGVDGFPHTKIFYHGRIGYGRVGTLNATEMEAFIVDGVQFTKKGHARTVAMEKEKQKDAEVS